MTLKKLFSLNLTACLAAILLLNSCTSDEPTTSQTDTNLTNGGIYAVSIEEAIDYANLVFEEMGKDSSTGVIRGLKYMVVKKN